MKVKIIREHTQTSITVLALVAVVWGAQVQVGVGWPHGEGLLALAGLPLLVLLVLGEAAEELRHLPLLLGLDRLGLLFQEEERLPVLACRESRVRVRS